jgi:hypothetical protein
VVLLKTAACPRKGSSHTRKTEGNSGSGLSALRADRTCNHQIVKWRVYLVVKSRAAPLVPGAIGLSKEQTTSLGRTIVALRFHNEKWCIAIVDNTYVPALRSRMRNNHRDLIPEIVFSTVSQPLHFQTEHVLSLLVSSESKVGFCVEMMMYRPYFFRIFARRIWLKSSIG